jgi:uncharacterized protein YjiS (DUF1127 family)
MENRPKSNAEIVHLEATMSATTHNTLTGCQAAGGPSSHDRIGVAARVGKLFAAWRRRIQERDAFAHLDERDLHDIGLSQWEVETELAKPFWRE